MSDGCVCDVVEGKEGVALVKVSRKVKWCVCWDVMMTVEDWTTNMNSWNHYG